MSMPKSRDSGVVIEYEPESDEDANVVEADHFDTVYTEDKGPFATWSEESLKNKKIHKLSSVAFARFPAHYDDNSLRKTQPPSGTSTKRFRYGREAERSHCHWKPKKPGPEMVQRGTQVALMGSSTSKLAKNHIHNMSTQTKVAQSIEVPPDPVKIPDYSDTLDDILHLIKKIKKSCPGPHVPDGMVDRVNSTLGDLMKHLKLISRKEDAIEETTTFICEELKKQNKPCPGVHVPENTVHSMHQLLLDVEEILHNYKTKNSGDLLEHLKERLSSLQKLSLQLQEGNNGILKAIQDIDVTCPGPHVPKTYIQDSRAMLIEILEHLKDKKMEITEYLEPMAEVNVASQCACSDIAAKARTNPKFNTKGFTPGLCQHCVNDHRGREFIKKLTLPISKTPHFINLIGYILQAVMDDEEERFEVLMRQLKKSIPDWKPAEHQVFYEALLHLALIWDRQICAQHIVGHVNVSSMFEKVMKNAKVFNICDFLKSAAGAQNPEVLLSLLDKLNDRQRIIVINSPSIFQGVKILPIFEAARRGDVKCFEILAEKGAEFDLYEKGRTIVHELVRLSGKKLESRHSEDWEVAITKMMNAVYDNASRWWERHQGKSEYSNGSSAARKSALQYLFWHCFEKKKGMSIVEYAASTGSAYIMKKIMTNIPYHFLPDPFEPGFYTGDEGYVVDDVDSNTVPEGLCVLDYVTQRKPEDAGPILRLEPFYSLIEDKWLQYKPFYLLMFFLYFLYMCVYTACAFERPPLSETTFDQMYSTNRDWARFIGELVCLFCLPLFLYGEFRMCCNKRFQMSAVWNWFGVFRGLNILFVIFTLVVLILRCVRNENEDVILAIAVLIGWFNATVFLGAWRSTGSLPIAMHMAVVKDVIPRFLPLYIFILLATSASTYIAFQWADPIVPQYTNATFFQTPLTLFKMTFALSNSDFVDGSREPAIGIILFIVHIIVGVVLIFFLLLAMIADTYRRTHKILDQNWVWVRANFVLYLEARLPSAFYISYDRSERRRPFSFMAKSKLKYVKKIDRRRNQDGRIVDIEQHAVMIGRDDPPIPNPPPLKMPPPDIAALKPPSPKKNAPLPPPPQKTEELETRLFNGAVIDMADDVPTLRTTYDSIRELPEVEQAEPPNVRATTYLHGKGNRVTTSSKF